MSGDTTSDGDGQQGKTNVGLVNWREHVPEFARTWEEVTQSETADAFYKQIENQRKMMGASIRIPGEDAGTEQMGEFHQRLIDKVPGLMKTPDYSDADSNLETLTRMGAPGEAKGYVGVEGMSEDRLAQLRETAFNTRMTKTQFKKYAEQAHEQDRTAREAGEAKAQANKDALQKQWGAATDIRREQAAVLAAKTGAPKSLVEAVEAGLADVETMAWLHGLGKQLGMEESTLRKQSDVLAPVEIDNKIEDIMGNVEHPYWNSSHPKHQAAVDNMMKLRRQQMN